MNFVVSRLDLARLAVKDTLTLSHQVEVEPLNPVLATIHKGIHSVPARALSRSLVPRS